LRFRMIVRVYSERDKVRIDVRVADVFFGFFSFFPDPAAFSLFELSLFFAGNGKRMCALNVVLLLLFLLSGSVHADENADAITWPWRKCVEALPTLYLRDATRFYWTPAARTHCGFQEIDAAWARHGDTAFPSELTAVNNKKAPMCRAHTFVGDSTAFRSFAGSVKLFLPPREVDIGPISERPMVMEEREDAGPSAGCAALRFVRLAHVSLWPDAVSNVFTAADSDGLVSFSLGNWDMNWLIRYHYPLPGAGYIRSFDGARDYWTTHVAELMGAIAQRLSNATAGPPPIVLIKEQMLPNCAAGRFQRRSSQRRGGTAKNPHCPDLLRPAVVPMYRRVLARVAHALDIPVVPVDLLSAPGPQGEAPLCPIGDGVHLDAPCQPFELNLIWNVYALLRRRGVRQGVPPDTVPPPFLSLALEGANLTAFTAWAEGLATAAASAASPESPATGGPPISTAAAVIDPAAESESNGDSDSDDAEVVVPGARYQQSNDTGMLLLFAFIIPGWALYHYYVRRR
jgi:hypothetical protein